MFVYTVKASSLKFFAVLILSVAALVTLIALIPADTAAGDVAAVATDFTDIGSEEKRIEFIGGFGYLVSRDGCEIETVKIPEEFDSAYTAYNDIQRAQGLNLRKYGGKSVTRYSYYITNYEGYEGKVMVTLLIYRDRVIGGDVTGLGSTGFVHGFEKPVPAT